MTGKAISGTAEFVDEDLLLGASTKHSVDPVKGACAAGPWAERIAVFDNREGDNDGLGGKSESLFEHVDGGAGGLLSAAASAIGMKKSATLLAAGERVVFYLTGGRKGGLYSDQFVALVALPVPGEGDLNQASATGEDSDLAASTQSASSSARSAASAVADFIFDAGGSRRRKRYKWVQLTRAPPARNHHACTFGAAEGMYYIFGGRA